MKSKNKIKKLFIGGAALSILASCQDTSFKGGAARPMVDGKNKELSSNESSDSVRDPLSVDDTDPTHKLRNFELTASKGKVDVIWLIDTSGSMDQETQIVKDNFARFITNLSDKTDVKVTLIAKKHMITLTPEQTALGHLAIDKYVSSTDALKVAVTQLRGSLSARLRPDAKPVFVVVTDDNAVEVTSENFITLADPYLNGQKPTVFAFRGLASKPGCGIAKRGTEYEKLATDTGGKVFDICDADWTPNFGVLVDAVAQIANTKFSLDDPEIVKILQVIVDGNPLPLEAYKLEGNVVTLVAELVPANARSLVIKYEVPK